MDEWDKYAVDSQSPKDDWEQYQVNKPLQPKSSISDILGPTLGLGAVGGVGYGLLKTGLPQKVGAGIGTIGQGVANFPKVINTQKGDAFAKQIRGAFVEAHSNKIAGFGGQLENLTLQNPTKVVNLQNVVDDIVGNFNEMAPEVKGIIRRTPFLRDMVKPNKPMSPDITLKQTQDIINYLNTKVPKNIRANSLELIDTINNIKGAQLDAFPEMEGIRADYKKFIEPYKNVKNYFKFNKILNAIKNKFGGAEGQTAVESILPTQSLKQMKGYRSAAKMAEIPGEIPLVGRILKSLGGIFTLAPWALQALTFSQQIEAAKKAGAFRIDVFGNIVPIPKDVLEDALRI